MRTLRRREETGNMGVAAATDWDPACCSGLWFWQRAEKLRPFSHSGGSALFGAESGVRPGLLRSAVYWWRRNNEEGSVETCAGLGNHCAGPPLASVPGSTPSSCPTTSRGSSR